MHVLLGRAADCKSALRRLKIFVENARTPAIVVRMGNARAESSGLEGRFPLTPALSPGEREKRSPLSVEADNCRGRHARFVSIRVHSW